MKRIICLITALCLIFGSFSFCFAADWTDSDKQHLQSIDSSLYYMNHTAAYYLYNIATNTNNLYNKAVDIYNALNYGSHSISYWVNAISTWMSPIYTSITSIPTDLSVIQGLLGYPQTNQGGGTTWIPYARELNNTLSVNTMPLYYWTVGANGNVTYDQQLSSPYTYAMSDRLTQVYKSALDIYTQEFLYNANNYNTQQNAINWGNLGTSSFTPLSVADGTFKWLSAIQAPVARLSYVLANDQEIEARDAVAANQDAVVDNFIDSTGNGSASPSDIGSISDLSSGYKSNFGSDASVSGIFNIFNSNNMGWFSQETANQLDTTTPSRRGSSFNTPLLDQQIEDIYDQIGVKHD